MDQNNLKLLRINDAYVWYNRMKDSGFIGFTSGGTHTCYYVGSDGLFCLGGFLAEKDSQHLNSTLSELNKSYSHFYIVVEEEDDS